MRLALSILAIVTLAAPAVSQEAMPGRVGTLQLGYWACGTPGLATGPAMIENRARDFETIRGSRYRVGEEIGTYLRLSERVTMTGGVLEGRAFRVESENRVRIVEDGAETDITCLRRPA